jgi:hypothetical protein
MALMQKGDKVMGTQLPQISPVTTQKPTYSQALVAYALCHKGQLYMVAYQYNFTDGKTIKEQEAIIRDHLAKPASENGDREINRETLVSVNRMHTETENRKFSETFEPLARQIDKALQESNRSGNPCTAFIVNNPHNGFSDQTALNQNSSYSAVLSAVNRAGNAALAAHRRQR